MCGKFPVTFMQHYLEYDNTDFSSETAPITRVMAIRARVSANYCPPCSRRVTRHSKDTLNYILPDC